MTKAVKCASLPLRVLWIGKSTLATLLPELLEEAYSDTWNMEQGVGQMPAPRLRARCAQAKERRR